MESPTTYQNDFTEEDMPTPAQRDDVAHTLALDPDPLGDDAADDDEEEDDEDEDLGD